MNSEILYNQSLDYLKGKGVKEDLKKAFTLNAEAADNGHHDAVMAMGWYYLNGCGISKDTNKAKLWYKKSVRQGNSTAMFTLGQIAYTERVYLTAFKWFQLAIENKDCRSIFWLGKLYWYGRGVNKNKQKALLLFNEAATKKVKEAKRTISWLNRIAKQNDSK